MEMFNDNAPVARAAVMGKARDAIRMEAGDALLS